MTREKKEAILKIVRDRIKVAKRQIMLAGSYFRSKEGSVMWYQRKRKLRRLRDKLVLSLSKDSE